MTDSGNLHFQPHWLARHPHFQTVVSSLKRASAPRLLAAAREITLNADGVRLQGYYSARESAPATVLLLHGWLGHAHANYILAVGERLFNRGYSVFRLNFRDHGGTHSLNPGIFRSDRLDEVFAAARLVAHLAPDKPLHLVGASLGGNFALRLAGRHSQTPLPNLGHTVAICPAIDPHTVTLKLDHSRLYLPYFRRKWRQTFRQKQHAFPDRYDFSAEIAAPTCMAMTEEFMRRQGPYPDARTYFENYAVTPTLMASLTSPVTLVAAADDPIIPVADVYPLQGISPQLRVSIQPHGGHVGFIDILPFRYWLADAVPSLLQRSQP